MPMVRLWGPPGAAPGCVTGVLAALALPGLG
jgi:hypothetical protein